MVLSGITASVVVGVALLSVQARDADVKASILAAERMRFNAMTSEDFDVLESLLAEELTYCHSSGLRQSKNEFMRSIRAREFRYAAIALEGVPVVQVFGETAVVTGRAQVRAESKGGQSLVQIQFTDVYVRRNGRWLQVAWQATPARAPA